MTKLTVGQAVKATHICHFDHEDKEVLEGIVVATEGEPGMTLINFGAHFDGHNGYGHVNGFGPTLWWVQNEYVTPKDAPAPKGNQQSDRILKHLLSGKSITQLEAFGVYRIFRLAARIHELKSKGHKIVTTMRMDETGKQYAEYSLVTARRA